MVEVQLNQKLVNGYLSRVESSKKVSAKDADVKATVVKLFDYVNYFNTLDEVSTTILGRQLSDIIIINELVPFIIPRSVKLVAGDPRCKELLARNVAGNDVHNYSYLEFVNLQSKFRSYFKKDINSDVTTLDSLKKSVSLSEVLDRVSVVIHSNGVDQFVVCSSDNLFIPLELCCDVKEVPLISNFFKDYYWNLDSSNMIDMFISKLTF